MLAKIYEQNPSEKELQRVVDALERDEIIIYPTDSVYAFGCFAALAEGHRAAAPHPGQERGEVHCGLRKHRPGRGVLPGGQCRFPDSEAQSARAVHLRAGGFGAHSGTRRSNGAARSASAFRPAPSRGPWSGRWGVR